MRKKDSLFGAILWAGEYKGMPAIVGSYHGGGSLYVFKDGAWYEYARGETDRDVTPGKCPECGGEIPVENIF